MRLGFQNEGIDRAVFMGQVPDPGGAVETAGQDRASIGTKVREIDPRLIAVGKGADSGSPVVASQSRAEPSSLHVARRRPSGLQSTALT